MTVDIEGLSVHLAHPDELQIRWVGQEELMRQLLAAWMVLNDLFLAERHHERLPRVASEMELTTGQLHLLLTGSLTLSEVVTFDGLPDIPISDFRLTFSAPPGLLTANRELCAPPAPVFHADFTGYNGATSSVDSPASVVGCGGGKNGGVGAKCKKAKKKKHHHRAAESKKKHKKKSCKKKKRHKKHH